MDFLVTVCNGLWKRCGEGNLPVHECCEGGVGVLEIAIREMEYGSKGPISKTLDNLVNNRRKRCIDLAVKLNNVPVLLHLLSLRVNCEAFVYEDKYGVEKACKSPLLVACEKGFSTVARILTTVGNGNLDRCSGEDGSTALMMAVRGSWGKVVKFLLRCGADVNVADDKGRCLRTDLRKFKGTGKEGRKCLRLIEYCGMGWCEKIESAVWTKWGRKVVKLVMEGGAEAEFGWGLGYQGDDIRREILGWLGRDDFIANRRRNGREQGKVVEGDFWDSIMEDGESGGEDEAEEDNNAEVEAKKKSKWAPRRSTGEP